MQISREMAMREMESVRKALGAWIRELKDPKLVDPRTGEPVNPFPNGVPEGLSVAEMNSFPVPQLRAELNVLAAKLEALAST